MGSAELWPEGELFYQLPKCFFGSYEFETLSVHAKVLYSILLDRQKLSYVNGWFDKSGEIFIYFSIEEIAKTLNVGRDKARKTLAELEGIDLITREKQGFGKCTKIYVHTFKKDCSPI